MRNGLGFGYSSTLFRRPPGVQVPLDPAINSIIAARAFNASLYFVPGTYGAIFQDTLALMPVTADGQGVGFSGDKQWGAANVMMGAAMMQSTLADRPLVQGREVLGIERVTNGDFSGGTTDWAGVFLATISVVSGRLRVTATGGTNPYAAHVSFAVEAGKKYRLQGKAFRGTAAAGTLTIGVGSTATLSDINMAAVSDSGSGDVTMDTTFTALTNTCYVRARHSNTADGTYFELDDFSLKEITKESKLLAFDGVTDYMVCDRTPQASGTLMWSGTVPALAAGGRVFLGAGGNANGQRGACLRMNNSKPMLSISNGTSQQACAGTADLGPGQVVIMARWRPNEQELYINGVLINATTWGLDPTNNLRMFTLHRQGGDIAANYLGGAVGPALVSNEWMSNEALNTICTFAAGEVGAPAWTNLPVTTVTAPALSSLTPYQTAARTYRNVPWGDRWSIPQWEEPVLPPGDRTCFPVIDIDVPAGVPADFGHTDGKWPIFVHAHPGGNRHTIVNASTPDIYLRQRCLTVVGHVFISISFPHPAFTPGTSNNITGWCIQFIRSLHVALNLNLEKMTYCGRSRGNFGLIASLQADLLNLSSNVAYADHMSSIPNLYLCVNTQGWYNTRRAAEECVDNPSDYAAFYNNPNIGQPNEAMPCMADMVATAPQLPVFVTTYDKEFPKLVYGTEKVNYTLIDNTHWSQSGAVYLREYYKRGRQNDIICWAGSDPGGPSEQLGAYCWAANEYWRGAHITDAMASGIAREKNHTVSAIRADLAGCWQNIDTSNNATNPVTAAGQPIAGIADMTQGIAQVAANPLVGKPLGQTNTTIRPLLAAAAVGWGYACGSNGRMFMAHAGSASDAREVRYWGTSGNKYTVPATSTPPVIGFGWSPAANDTVLLSVGAPLGTVMDAQADKVYSFAVWYRRQNWTQNTGAGAP